MDWAERLRGWSLVWHKIPQMFADGSYIQEEKMLLGDFQLPGWSNIQPTISQEPWASLFNSRDLQVQDGRWKIFETSKCTVWLRFMAWFFERNSAFLQETCMPSIFEESFYHQVDLTNHFMSESRRWKGRKRSCFFLLNDFWRGFWSRWPSGSWGYPLPSLTDFLCLAAPQDAPESGGFTERRFSVKRGGNREIGRYQPSGSLAE